MMAKRLARMNVGDVQLDQQHAGALDRVVQRDRGVGVGAGVEDDAGERARGVRAAGLVDPVDELALVVRLPEVEDEAVLRAIDKTEVLPRDTDGRVPPSLEISFRPRD